MNFFFGLALLLLLFVALAAGETEKTPLHRIVRSGSVPALVEFLSGPSLDLPSLHVEDDEGFFPLRLAASLHRLDVLDPLVRLAGADPNQRSKEDGWSALHAAVLSKSPALAREMVGELLRLGADVNLANTDGDTPLMMACLEDLPEVVSDLLARGGNPESVSLVDGYAPLHAAAQHDSAGSIRRLLQAGANANARTTDADTPLMIAVVHRSLEAVEELLRVGGAKVDVNAEKADGSTAAEMVAAMGSREMALLLARSGADLAKRNSYGRTARQTATDHGHDGLFDEPEEEEEGEL